MSAPPPRWLHQLAIGALLSVLMALSASAMEEEKLIGWKGDSYVPELAEGPWIEQISWKPRASILHNLISKAEAQHIIDLAWPIMRRSEVEGDNESDGGIDDYRTSYGTFLSRHRDPVLKAIQHRVSDLIRLPVQNQEDMQVLRYGVGQYYHEHTDSLAEDSPRAATLLIYLHEPEEGGETSFPAKTSHWIHSQAGQKYSQGFSECAQGHVAFKPKLGDGLLFWSLNPDGKTEDPNSLHEGCPVLKGVKWTATVWFHPIPFRPDEFNGTHFEYEIHPEILVDPGFCEDQHHQCQEWAKAGECENNPGFMKGEDHDGFCRAACGSCRACEDVNDIECYNVNRKSSGYLSFDPKDMRWYSETGLMDRMRRKMSAEEQPGKDGGDKGEGKKLDG